MKRGFLFLFFTGCAILSVAQSKAVQKLKTNTDAAIQVIQQPRIPKIKSPSLYVDPFVGTGGHGHTFPGATAPFGFIQLSPDTRIANWDGCGGYHYSDSIIYGFSHTHLSGVGVPDLCDILVVPQQGTCKTEPGYASNDGYGHSFSHDNESASPGFYSVSLEKSGINAKFTVSEHAGIHNYQFTHAAEKKYLLIDLDHRDELLEAFFHQETDNSFAGGRISNSWATEQHVYFYFTLSEKPKKVKYIRKNGKHKLLLLFPRDITNVELRIGISAVDEQGAKQNLLTEIPANKTFDQIRAEVTKKWNQQLGKIQFYSEEENYLKLFYTSLYHSFIHPSLFSDNDARYRGMDNQIHLLKRGESQQYSIFSLWDTFRSTHPLYTWIEPEKTVDFMETFDRQLQQGKTLPVWELYGNETNCMIGYHSVSVISDAISKGLIPNNLNNLKYGAIHAATKQHTDRSNFLKGFLDASQYPESVSKTLEYSYDNYCLSLLLKGSKEFPKALTDEIHRSEFHFMNLLDPQTGFMRARKNGCWISPFLPSEVNHHYTEANSYHYSLFAPHAIDILKDALGGEKALESWLDTLFLSKNTLLGKEQVDITGLIGQYAHGNEPSHHMAYLYNFTNAPHKTQFYVDKILHELYQLNPSGLAGNEDCGQMSSWFVMSALGLYQLSPGYPVYDVGRPLLDEAIIELGNEKKLHIIAKNNSQTNCYVQEITWNGRKLNSLQLAHDTLFAGGELIFQMGNLPNTTAWNISHSPRNTADLIHSGFVPVPYLSVNSGLFTDSLPIKCSTISIPGIRIETYYQWNDAAVQKYQGPIQITSDGILRYWNYSPTNGGYSDTLTTPFYRLRKDIHLKLKTPATAPYQSTGENALIDGLTGLNEYRTGDYQGFWGQNFEAEIAFDTPKNISEIGISALQDMKSWIFFPSRIEISYSVDGTEYKNLPAILSLERASMETTEANSIPVYDSIVPPSKQEFKIKLDANYSVKSIRIRAIPVEKCPKWHPAAGNPTWMFFDEILFNK